MARNFTTLTIAHRVKTIMNSDKIFVLAGGKVKEEGKFKSLERFRDLEVKVDEDDDD